MLRERGRPALANRAVMVALGLRLAARPARPCTWTWRCRDGRRAREHVLRHRLHAAPGHRRAAAAGSGAGAQPEGWRAPQQAPPRAPPPPRAPSRKARGLRLDVAGGDAALVTIQGEIHLQLLGELLRVRGAMMRPSARPAGAGAGRRGRGRRGRGRGHAAAAESAAPPAPRRRLGREAAGRWARRHQLAAALAASISASVSATNAMGAPTVAISPSSAAMAAGSRRRRTRRPCPPCRTRRRRAPPWRRAWP